MDFLYDLLDNSGIGDLLNGTPLDRLLLSLALIIAIPFIIRDIKKRKQKS